MRKVLYLALAIFAMGCQSRSSEFAPRLDQMERVLLEQERLWQQDRQACVKQVTAVRCRSDATKWYDLPPESVNSIFAAIRQRKPWPGRPIPKGEMWSPPRSWVYRCEIDFKDESTLGLDLMFGCCAVRVGGRLFVIPEDDFARLKRTPQARVSNAVYAGEPGTPLENFPVQ